MDTPSGSGWIYAAREDGTPLVKIGYTLNLVPYRLQTLHRQYKTPFTLLAASYVPRYTCRVEHRIHSMLAPQRITGEWFYLHMSQQMLDTLVAQAYTDVLDDIATNGWDGAQRAYQRNYAKTHGASARANRW
jgi:Meiotically up-regulated gene 113